MTTPRRHLRRRYDTTPTDDDRAQARDFLDQVGKRSPSILARRDLRVAVYLGESIAELTEADNPDDARRIARARAMYEVHREEEP